MRLSAALTAYFYAKELSPRSRSWYHQKLTEFITWAEAHTCPLHENAIQDIAEVDTALVREFLNHLKVTPSQGINHRGTPPSSETLHGYARVIKAWLNFCIAEGLLPERVTRRLEMPKRERKVIAVFTRQQIDALFAACERPGDTQYPWLAERDRTILMLLLDTGMRASELCGLTLDTVHLEHGVARDDAYLTVMGKGRRQRECPLGQRGRRQLHRYLHRFRPHVLGETHIFLGRDGRPLDNKGLGAVLYRLKHLSGIEGVRCSPHDFRHTFAYTYLANGGDVMRLSRLLGHTDLATTQIYLRAFTSREARQNYVSVLDNL
jgi:site-specific recombinase XerD